MIDSHQHFWQVGRFEYPWMKPDVGAPGRYLIGPVATEEDLGVIDECDFP